MTQNHGHASRLTIDAAALTENYRTLAKIAGVAECAAVVKANGYGLGIETVVPLLARAGCHTFFVAHLSEAQRARKAHPLAHIYVLNGMPPGTEGLYIADKLRPVLGTVDELTRWRIIGGPAALHVDTGMNRLGLSIEEAKSIVSTDLLAGSGVELLMSHMVSSEVPDDALNPAQIHRFERVAGWFQGKIPRLSLANSSAHFLPHPPRYNLTRPGYALYGGNPTPGKANPMKPVVRLESTILQLRSIGPGEHVGYNAQWSAKRPSTIATLSIGYADGWPRSLSAPDGKPGGEVIIHGKRCPFAGRVSMDLITVDVTECPPGSLKVGDLAVMLGDEITVDDVAAKAGTNGYEILTSLGRRHERRLSGH
jgi:alanine racemase